MASDELGSGVNNNIGTVLDGTDQIGSTKGVVNDKGNAVLMGQICPGLNVDDITGRVAQGLNIERLGILLNGCLCSCQIRRANESGLDAIILKGMLQEVIGSAVDIVGRYQMI